MVLSLDIVTPDLGDIVLIDEVQRATGTPEGSDFRADDFIEISASLASLLEDRILFVEIVVPGSLGVRSGPRIYIYIYIYIHFQMTRRPPFEENNTDTKHMHKVIYIHSSIIRRTNFV